METKPVLIAYTTNAGSTAEVAALIAEEIGRNGQPVEVRRLEEVLTLSPYRAAVIGAPMILGWHRAARRFVRKHAAELCQIPVACFATAMALTQEAQPPSEVLEPVLDPWLAQPSKNPRRLTPKERFTSVSYYLHPILNAAPAVRPISVAFFGGKLELFRLKWWQLLFVLLIVRAQPGDLRNTAFIRSWAAQIRPLLAGG
jgi:menaquinone-dependent protoporphyrinogen oxidase